MKSIVRLFSFAIIATTICGAYGANVSTRAVSKRSTVANSTQTKSTRSTTRQQSAAKRGVANRSAVTYRANPYKTFSNGYQQTRMYIHKDLRSAYENLQALTWASYSDMYGGSVLLITNAFPDFTTLFQNMHDAGVNVAGIFTTETIDASKRVVNSDGTRNTSVTIPKKLYMIPATQNATQYSVYFDCANGYVQTYTKTVDVGGSIQALNGNNTNVCHVYDDSRFARWLCTNTSFGGSSRSYEARETITPNGNLRCTAMWYGIECPDHSYETNPSRPQGEDNHATYNCKCDTGYTQSGAMCVPNGATQYKIKYHCDPGTGSVASGKRDVAVVGETFRPADGDRWCVRDGYIWSGWQPGEYADVDIVKDPFVWEWTDADVRDFYAVWRPEGTDTFNVSYQCTYGGTPPASNTATYDETYTMPSNTCNTNGKEFKGWIAVGERGEPRYRGTEFKWWYTKDIVFRDVYSSCPAYSTEQSVAGTSGYNNYVTDNCKCKTGYEPLSGECVTPDQVYTITYVCNAPSATTVTWRSSKNTDINLSDGALCGTYPAHEITGWNCGGTTYALDAKYTGRTDMTCNAVWESTCPEHSMYKGNTGVAGQNGFVTEYCECDDGYVFFNGICKDPNEEVIVNLDCTEGEGSPEPLVADEDGNVKLPSYTVCTRSGYGMWWMCDGVRYDVGKTFKPTHSTTCEAEWVDHDAIEFACHGNDNVMLYCSIGSSYTISTFTAAKCKETGKHICGWSKRTNATCSDSDVLSPDASVTCTDDPQVFNVVWEND